MKHVKKLLALLLMVAMLLPLLPAIPVHAATITSYKLNDKIEFGWYPQTKVTDSSVISALNAKVADDDWVSYGYYSGDGDECMKPGDWMQ